MEYLAKENEKHNQERYWIFFSGIYFPHVESFFFLTCRILILGKKIEKIILKNSSLQVKC